MGFDFVSVFVEMEEKIDALEKDLKNYGIMAQTQYTKIAELESRISAHDELLRILSNALLAMKHRVEDLERSREKKNV